MSPRRAVLVILGLSLLAVPVAAHGNYVSTDSQVSADGTVRMELTVILADGFVVLHADAGGEPGEPVGHGAIEPFVHPDYAVDVDAGWWANRTGNVSLWAVLHHDDGDGEFHPSDDPPLRTGADDRLVADRFAVRKAAAGPTNVMAEREKAQATGTNVVTIRRVRLASDGYVVIRAAEAGPGRIVGQRALPAGNHSSVNVTIDETFYERRPEDFKLWAVVHASDGDDTFEPAEDPAVRVGNGTVMTRFAVERTDPIEQTPTPEATPTAKTAAPHTVTETPTHHGDHEHTTATSGHGDHDHSPTATQEAGHDDHDHTHEGETATTARSGEDGHDHTHSETATASPGQPGFGVGLAVLGVLLAGLLAYRRRPA